MWLPLHMPGSLPKYLTIAAILASLPALAGESKKIVLDVPAMSCALCSITVKKVLQRAPGYVDAKVDLDTKRAVVIYEPDKSAPHAFARALTEAGFPATIVQE